MKKLILLTCILFTSFIIKAQSGKIVEGQKIVSKIMGKEVKYTMYLPADYDASKRSYPIVYMLHGYGDDDTGWAQFGEINRYADKAILNGDIAPMIIAMPDGGVSFYINAADGKTNYEDFFIKEFMPLIENTYRVKKEKRFRGIAGLSMGGYGTFNYAMKYPDLFAACAPLSAAAWEDSEIIDLPASEFENGIFGTLFGKGLKGKDRLSADWNKNSPIYLATNAKVEDLKKMRYWIDCGDDDFLVNGNMAIHKILRDKGVPHEFRVRDGVHNWTYWRTGITDALKFISESFHQ